MHTAYINYTNSSGKTVNITYTYIHFKDRLYIDEILYRHIDEFQSKFYEI